MKIINRKARFKYEVVDKLEAGIVLGGAEIKSIRGGRAELSEAFARIRDGEVFLVNAYVKSWMGSQKYAGERRDRKLLLHKNQILNFQGKMAGGNLTIVPLSIYIKNNLAKVDLGLAKAKAKYDKRATLRKKTIERDVERELRGDKE